MTNPALAAKIAADFIQSAEELEAITARDYILAWDNGLAVRLDEGNTNGRVTNIENATQIVSEEQARTMPEEAWAFTPIVRNGHNEQAKIVTRFAAAQRQAAELRRLAADLSN